MKSRLQFSPRALLSFVIFLVSFGALVALDKGTGFGEPNLVASFLGRCWSYLPGNLCPYVEGARKFRRSAEC